MSRVQIPSPAPIKTPSFRAVFLLDMGRVEPEKRVHEQGRFVSARRTSARTVPNNMRKQSCVSRLTNPFAHPYRLSEKDILNTVLQGGFFYWIWAGVEPEKRVHKQGRFVSARRTSARTVPNNMRKQSCASRLTNPFARSYFRMFLFDNASPNMIPFPCLMIINRQNK